MRNRKDYCAISVESRKGGVGKTTIALNLARLLLEEGYPVLFLDLDITGTEASQFVASLKKHPFWTEFIHAVQSPHSKSNENSNDTHMNVVTLFEQYMTGEAVPDVTWDGKGTQGIELKKDMINILSSKLRRDTGNESKRGPRYSPEVLFDELHSQWFIGMIRELVEKSAEKVSSKKNLAVIIDNAPGYSGLEPEVEEWLLTLGPECGKFLLVGSLDTQDLASCFESIQEIHELYRKKWDTSRLLLQDNHSEIPAGTDLAFLNRLVESMPLTYKKDGNNQATECTYPAPKGHTNCTGCGLCFYRQKADNNDKNNAAIRYRSDASLYTALVVNKAHELVKRKRYEYDLSDIAMQAGYQAGTTLESLKDISSAKGVNDTTGTMRVLTALPARTVPYIEALSYQFIADRIKAVPVQEQVEDQRVTLSLERTGELLTELENIKHSFQYKNAWKPSKKVDAIFNQLLLFDKASTITDSNKILDFLDIEHSLFFASIFSALSYLGINDSDFDIDQARARDRDIARDRARDIDIARDRDIARDIAKDRAKDREIAREINIEIARDIARDIDIDIGDIARDIDIGDIARDIDIARDRDMTVIVLLISHINALKMNVPPKGTAFWKKQALDRELAIMTAREIYNPLRKRLKNIKVSPEGLADIYMTFCLTRVRHMEARMDFNFLMDCLKTIVVNRGRMRETEVGTLKEIAREVVIEKTMSNRAGRGHLKEMGYADIVGEMDMVAGDKGRKDPYEQYKKMRASEEILKALRSVAGRGQWGLL